MTADPQATTTAFVAGMCISLPREVRRAKRVVTRRLRKQAGHYRRSEIRCQVHYGADRAREALALHYTDPSPADVAELDQAHAFIADYRHVALVVARCEVVDLDAER